MARIQAVICFVTAFPVLAGCAGDPFDTGDQSARLANGQSGFRAVSGGQVDVALRQEENGSVTRSGVGEVVYVSGIGTEVSAFAGVASDSGIGPEVTTGTARYRGPYECVLLTEVSRTNPVSAGRRETISGTIPLTADFDAGTLTGNAQFLRVSGTITGQGLSGSVVAKTTGMNNGPRLDNIQGALTGSVGADGVVGAFHGAGIGKLVAGGFVAPPR